jgi:twitching motility protein PilI
VSPLPERDPLALLRRWSAAFAASATALPAGAQPAPAETLIAFQLAGSAAFIDLAWLDEILPVGAITRIPQVQPWMRGVANVRGKLLPVVDGALFLGSPSGPARQQRILVLGTEDCSAGLIVDRVDGLRRLPHDAFVAAERLAEGPLKRYAAGGLNDPGRGLVPLLAPALLFDDPGFRDASLRDTRSLATS